MVAISLTANGLWVEADLAGDPEATACELVLHRWHTQNIPRDNARIKLLIDLVTVLIRDYQSEDPPPLHAMLLYPYAEEVMAAVAAVRYEFTEVPLRLDEIADATRLPAEMLEQPALEEVVQTASGPALHLLQRHRTPASPEVEKVEEHDFYAWSVEDEDGPVVITLSTTYRDMAKAAEWRAELAELARDLVIQPDDA